MHYNTLYKLLLALTCASLILGACSPAPAPARPTPTSLTETEKNENRPSDDNTLKVVDDGAPLPPRVVDRRPAGGEPLPTGEPIRLSFDQPMDAAKTAAALTVTGPQGEAVPGETAWEDQRTLAFTPARPLESGALYFAELKEDAASTAGAVMGEPYGFQFQTAPNLQVEQVFPADGAQGVAANTVITVIFNRPVTPLGIAEERDKLPDPLVITPAVDGQGEWVNTSVYAFTPSGGLQAGMEYKVTIKAGLKDALDQTALEQDYTWSFSTAAPAIEFFALSSGLYNPQNGAVNIRPDEYYTIKFLQPMDRASVEDALSLNDAAGQDATFKYEWQLDDTQVVVTPTQQLALNTGYTLQLEKTAQAATGGALAVPLAWNFTTLPMPAILSVTPTDGSSQPMFDRLLQVQFASPMRIDTVKERIQITPKPAKDPEWYYNDWDFSMQAYFLEPSTQYEVRFLPGMEDIYGNRISKETVIRFKTAPRPPSASLMMPWDVPMMRSGQPEGQEFYISAINLREFDIELYSLNLDEFIGLQTGRIDSYRFQPAAGQLVWKTHEQGNAQLNQAQYVKLMPETANGAPLPAGYYFIGVKSPDVNTDTPFADRRAVFVAGANLTFKTAPTDGLAWLTDLVSGAPLADKAVKVYDEGRNLLAEGRTDTDGLLKMTLPATKEGSYSRFAIVEDSDAFAFASGSWGSGVSAYDYGIWIDQYSPTNRPTAYVYTERPLYRPGQPVYFKGIVRIDDDLDYKLPDASQVQVKINSFEENISDETLKLSEFGTFDGKLTLDSEAALGYYTINVYLPGFADPIGSVTFNVAEYRKPEFQTTVEVSPKNVLSGDRLVAEVQADYYSGGGVAGAAVHWTLVSAPFYFQPPRDYSAYNFTDIEEDVWGYRDEGGLGSDQIATGDGVTDATGHFSIDLPVELNDVKTGRVLTFEATLTDLAGTSVSGRDTLTAHKSKVYPGIRSATYIGKVNEAQRFEIVALNWDGKPLPEHPIAVEIVERRWHSVQEQDANGRIEWKSEVEEIPVQSFTGLTTGADGKAEVSFTPPNGGVYRARVTSEDDQGNPASASAYMWVAGEEFIPWQQTNDRGFALVTDKKSYEPGETAQVLIASPFQGETYALVTVERGRIRASEVIRLQNNSTIYELPITADMSPNVFISVMVMKGVDDTNPRPNFKMGFARIEVDPAQRSLQVTVTPDREKAAPGQKVAYIVQTTDAEGEPVSAEVSLSLSDLATLSLLPPNSPPLMDHFYSERTLAVWTAMTIVNSMEDYNESIQFEVQEGAQGGGGGGKGDGELGVLAVRQDFPDTALWEAHLVTDATGQAAVTVTLPDNLTTWRMDARAVTNDTRVGQTTVDLISSRPLLVRPQTPRFFIANDQTVLGAAVHNNTEETLNVTVALEDVSGLEITSPVSQTIEIGAGRQAYVTWDATASPQAGRADMVFRATASGSVSGELQDASRPPQASLPDNGIPVYAYNAPETVGTSGMMTEGGTRVEGILLPQTMQAGDGELTIQVAPSLAAGMTDGLAYLRSFPYECIEQTVSRFLPNVLSTQAMKAAGLDDPKLEAGLQLQVTTALQRIYAYQNPDGGWGWWGKDKSDPLTSAYVVLGLYEAQQAGYTINADPLKKGIDYLHGQVKPLKGLQDPYEVNRQAFILYVLARAESADPSATVQLYDQRQRMQRYSQAFLAGALWIIDPADPRLKTLLADLSSAAVVSATGTHWEEDEIDRWNWNTDTRTTAIVLAMLGQIDPENPINANATRWLMSNRTNGHWRGTQETAWTLMALTRWMEASGELQANYKYAVALNGTDLGRGEATHDTLAQTQTFTVGMKDLLQDELNRLAFAHDGGPGNLYYTAHLNVTLPVEDVQALDQGIVVQRSYYRMDDMETPVTDAAQGELLLVRLTVIAPNALHYVVVDDPLPAGLESVDQSLQTSQQSAEVPEQTSPDELARYGWNWQRFERIEYHDEKVVLSASYLPAGTYVYTYLARAGTLGTYHVIPPSAYEFYFPEVFGRGEGSLFEVKAVK